MAIVKVNILNKIHFKFFDELVAEFPECEFVLGENIGFKDCEIVWGNLEVSNIKNYHKLKWIQSIFAGVDKYVDEKEIIPNGLKITAANGVYDITIAEYLLGANLSLYKNFHLYRDNQNENRWEFIDEEVKNIKNSKILVWGMGGIGSAYAKLVKNMGAYVIGVRREDKTKPDFVDELYLSDEVDKFIDRVDVIAITMPKTSKTINLINKEMISKTKDGVIIMNIGRGDIINTDDLCDALENGKIKGAVLDVVEPEPLPKEHKLWNMKNVIITPHISGLAIYKEPMLNNLNLFRRNLKKYLNNQQLINEVDFNEGYRKL